MCLNSLICSCDPKTCIHAHRSPNCLKLEFRVLHLLCLETVIWHQRPDSWHYVDLKTSQKLSTEQRCAQSMHECPSQPKLNRQTALQPHAPFWPYSVIHYYINSQYHFKRFPSTLLNTFQPGEFPPKRRKKTQQNQRASAQMQVLHLHGSSNSITALTLPLGLLEEYLLLVYFFCWVSVPFQGMNRDQVCDPDHPTCDVTLSRQASGVFTAKYFCLPLSMFKGCRK